MFRGVSVVLGVGLIILWIVGLSAHATLWLSWLDGVAGLVAILLGIAAVPVARAGVAGWGLMAFGLFILWIVGLAAHGPGWLAWWTFAFACAFIVLAAAATSGMERRLHQRTV